MSKPYKKGIVSPKGFDMAASEPVDQRSIVEYKDDLYLLTNVYPGLKVQVLSEIDGTRLREFKFMGGDSSNPDNWIEVSYGDGTGGAPGGGGAQFTSFVFKRNVGAPPIPVGGTYDDPIPPGWTDMVPGGLDPAWMSSAIFIEDSTDSPLWNRPMLLEDTDTMDFEYCMTSEVPPANLDPGGIPDPPLEGSQRPYWHNDPKPEDDWMAMGTKVGGEYPVKWNVVRIGGEKGAAGDPGPDGRAYTTSIVFTRSNITGMSTAVVSGGSFSSPMPTTTTIGGSPVVISWSDGVPMGDAKVWMCKFTFNDVDNEFPSDNNIWTTPGGITDTSTQDFEFSDNTTQPPDPTTSPDDWHNIAAPDDIWMATRSINNGVFGPWGITRIKGETGDQGQGLDIKGRDTIAHILNKVPPEVELYDIWLASDDDPNAVVPGLTNDAYLYVGDGNGEGNTAWDNIGPVTGTDGISYKQSYVFKRSIGVPDTPSGGSFTNPVPPGWSDGIPSGTDYIYSSNRIFSSTPDPDLEDWRTPTLAQDNLDFDFKYADRQLNDATPEDPSQAPSLWYDIPTPTRYWMAQQRLQNTHPYGEWMVVKIKGEQGEKGDNGAPSFLSSAYMKTNDDISGETVTGGTWASPVPTSTYVDTGGNTLSWHDGIPPGTGAVWFVQVQFSQDDTGTKHWPSPALTNDSATIEYQFSDSITKPISYPIEGGYPGQNNWYDDSEDVPGLIRWMAIGSIRNGVWPTDALWDIVQVIGEKGDPGDTARTYIPSSLFVRCDDDEMRLTSPIGQYMEQQTDGSWQIEGAYPSLLLNGTQYTFSDGIPPIGPTFPDNSIKVWMIQNVFDSVSNEGSDNLAHWPHPTILADNNGTDYQYHRGIDSNGNPPPAGDPGFKPYDPTGVGENPESTGWYDYPEDVPGGAYWLGQRNWSEGPSAQWKVYQIRGEDGGDGSTPDPGSPPSKVTNIHDTQIAFGRLWLEWNIPSDVDGDIDHYELSIKNTGELKLFEDASAYLYGLEEDVNYNIEVRAIDEAGNKGEWSDTYSSPYLDYAIIVMQYGLTAKCGSPYEGPLYVKKDENDGEPISVGDEAYTDEDLTQNPPGIYHVQGPSDSSTDKKITMSGAIVDTIDPCTP